MDVRLHVVYIITSIKIQRFKDGEISMKVVKRNIPLWGLVCFLVYWPGCLICWVPLTICM